MKSAYVVTGTLTDARTVTLDEVLTLENARVRLTVEPLSLDEATGNGQDTTGKRSPLELLETIWEGQRARGHRPPTREEVDAYVREERSSWGEG